LRIKNLGYTFLCLLLFLSFRLGYIAIIEGERLSKEATSQRTQKIPFKSVRGIIYDRNMLAITEGQNRLRVAVIPEECERIELVSSLLGEPINQKGIQIFNLNNVNEEHAGLLNMPGVMVFSVSERYNNMGLLSHIIGYTSDNGGFGIERAFEKQLIASGTDTISTINNANSKAISGLGYKKTDSKTYKGVKLSIDYHIQKITEKAMDNASLRGAAVVVDVQSGDIVAMASRPNFKQDDLANYLNSTDGELINRAISPYDVGSVFKVLMSAAALEEGVFTDASPFTCNGKFDVFGREFVCNKLIGHGDISLAEGLAFSCNVVFYQVGLKLGIKRISDYAKYFGFGEKVLNIDWMGEASGNIPSNLDATPQDIANISIGQGTVLVTPLQVADMLCTVANDGVRKQLTLVKSIVDDSGIAKDTKPVIIGRVISTDTAKTLKDILIGAVNFGTGTNAKIDLWGAGGKTGSAETGWEKDGETMTHGWFAGFFPADRPKYVCVVLSENGKQGGTSAAPVFKEIGEKIKDISR